VTVAQQGGRAKSRNKDWHIKVAKSKITTGVDEVDRMSCRATAAGRHVFLVFTVREKKGKRYIRPVSARYMHRKEMKAYEKENPDV